MTAELLHGIGVTGNIQMWFIVSKLEAYHIQLVFSMEVRWENGVNGNEPALVVL